MHCNNCGHDNLDTAKFCVKCGIELEKLEKEQDDNMIDNVNKGQFNETNINEVEGNIGKFKKLKIKPIILGVFLVMVLAASIFFIGNAQEKKINDFASKVSTHEKAFEQYILTDEKHEKDEYNELITLSKEIISNKKTDEIKGFLKKISELDDKISNANKGELEETLKQLEKEDISRAYDDELEKINDLKFKIKEDINKKQYKNANEKMNELDEIVKYVAITNDNLSIGVEQVDISEYPKIKLYLNIKDRYTNQVPYDLEKRFFYLSEKLSKDNNYIKKEIKKVSQLNEKESLNVNMVADVSGSMAGAPIDTAKYIMNNFLDNVQFGIGDKIELTAFSDGVYTLTDFTTNKQMISDKINYLNTGDMTSLYDALFAAVNKTAIQNGAKCIIAFTDGMDNNSKCGPQDVLNLADRYGIPIFIIGIGDSIDESTLSNIASKTHGFYSNILNINDMAEIYNKIYKQQKELYVLEYEITKPQDTFDIRNIKIDLQTRELGGICTFDYKPKLLLTANSELSGISDVDDLMGRYLSGYINAINNHDFSYIEKFIVKDGPLYKEVKPYIQKDIKEQLLSYEVIDKSYPDDKTCIVKIHDTYEVENKMEPLHMRTLESEYVLKKQSDGSWKFYAFNSRIKILSKINS
ncbi:VWA domain-containing protein [Lutibacter sp. B2]|nr:VWA domain-containing protein [Lutibacter sp. B2]